MNEVNKSLLLLLLLSLCYNEGFSENFIVYVSRDSKYVSDMVNLARCQKSMLHHIYLTHLMDHELYPK